MIEDGSCRVSSSHHKSVLVGFQIAEDANNPGLRRCVWQFENGKVYELRELAAIAVTVLEKLRLRVNNFQNRPKGKTHLWRFFGRRFLGIWIVCGMSESLCRAAFQIQQSASIAIWHKGHITQVMISSLVFILVSLPSVASAGTSVCRQPIPCLCEW